MKVALMDLDNSGFPNLALMKLAAWHKARGDDVQLNFLMGAEKVYASCIFSWNKKKVTSLPSETILGGWPLNTTSLTEEVEHIMPDYELYGKSWSIGFTSRGCYHTCPWCIVPQKEGPIQSWASIYEFWNPIHRRIKVLDNNLLAAPNAHETLQTLIIEGLEVDFCQGLDIRLVGEREAELLAQVKTWGILRFAFDRSEDESQVRIGIERLTKMGIHPTKLMFYMLFGAGETPEQNKRRLEVLNEYRVAVFPMFYVPLDSPSKISLDPPNIPKNALEYPQVRGPRGSYQKMFRRLKGG